MATKHRHWHGRLGITYGAGGVVRGVDLAKVFRYQPTQGPAFFGR